MLEGTVIISDLSALGNRIFHAGDKVTEDNFGELRFRHLVANGYIKCEELPPGPEPPPTVEPVKEPEPPKAEDDKTLDDLLHNSAFGSKKKTKKP